MRRYTAYSFGVLAIKLNYSKHIQPIFNQVTLEWEEEMRKWGRK